MNRRVFSFELNGKTVLGFDTGLDARSFAQAKMAWFISDLGTVVYPGGETESWQPEGVVENEAGPARTIIVWGPLFPGEEMASIASTPDRKDEALDTLRFWLKARMVLERKSNDKKEAPFPGPSGAFIVLKENQGSYPVGTVFFPPARLIKRTLETEGSRALLEAERTVHPDLNGQDGISFNAGAMLYQIFSDTPPFSGIDSDELRQNIREGVFIPPALKSPGLDPKLSELITQSISRVSQDKGMKNQPSPESINDFIGLPRSKKVSSWIRPLNEEERSKIRFEQEEYSKKNALKVKTRRFVIRNTAIITGAVILAIVIAFSIRGFIKHKAEMPSTRGMNPVEVANAYYDAFSTLDHPLMDACVIGKAGKQDIDVVMNLFVITRVRQAYEIGQETFMTAQEWINAGSPIVQATVFGVTDLSIKVHSQGPANASLEADYILWIPGTYVENDENTSSTASASRAENGDSIPVMPVGLKTSDRLNLVLNKGVWQISEINRTSSQLSF